VNGNSKRSAVAVAVLVPDGLLVAQSARQQSEEAHLSVFEYGYTVRRAAVAGSIRSFLILKLRDAI
jgi:hypothetical protein